MVENRPSTVVAAPRLTPAQAFADEVPRADNVIVMISDGAGLKRWLAMDYYNGRARAQPYPVVVAD